MAMKAIEKYLDEFYCLFPFHFTQKSPVRYVVAEVLSYNTEKMPELKRCKYCKTGL